LLTWDGLHRHGGGQRDYRQRSRRRPDDRTSVIATSVTDPTLFESAFNDTPIAFISGTRYVSRNGQDSLFDETDLLGVDLKDNNCTQPDTMPCRTVQQAASQAAPDDLIKIAQGVYTDVMSITHQSGC